MTMNSRSFFKQKCYVSLLEKPKRNFSINFGIKTFQAGNNT